MDNRRAAGLRSLEVEIGLDPPLLVYIAHIYEGVERDEGEEKATEVVGLQEVAHGEEVGGRPRERW